MTGAWSAFLGRNDQFACGILLSMVDQGHNILWYGI